jgi:hypothetical protein
VKHAVLWYKDNNELRRVRQVVMKKYAAVSVAAILLMVAIGGLFIQNVIYTTVTSIGLAGLFFYDYHRAQRKVYWWIAIGLLALTFMSIVAQMMGL